MSSSLKIRKITEADALAMGFISKQQADLGYRLGKSDVECHVVCEPGIHIAELNGVPIGSILLVQYSNDYYYFDMYIVDKEHRGKGYGMQIFNTVMNIDWARNNISALSVPDMANKYAETYGFKPRWLCDQYDLNLSISLDILNALPLSKDLTAKDVSDVEQDAILSYDTMVFGYKRHDFIKKWLHASGNQVKVVVNSDMDVVGYAVARVCYKKEEGYILGPLYADSTETARVLLKELFEKMKSHKLSPSESVCVYSPNGKNDNSKKLMDLLQGRCKVDGFQFMTTKGIPNGHFDKWFAVLV